MKRKFFCLFLALLGIFISCKHNKNNVQQGEDATLVLKSLKVHELDVDIKKLELEVPLKINNVTKENIEVQFNIYGVSCYVKGEEVVLREGEVTDVVLEVPARKGKYKAWTKTIKVTRKATEETELKNLLDVLEIIGGKVNNQVSSEASPNEIKAILEGKTVQVQIASPYAYLILGSKKASWSSLLINGEKVQSVLQGSYASVALKRFEFEKIGDVKEVAIELTAKRKTAKFSFKIERIEGIVDIPDLSLQINKQKYSAADKDLWAKLHNGSKPIIEALDPTQLRIECEHDFISSIKINDVDVGVIKKEGNIWYGAGFVEDLNSAGKDVKVEITPKNKNVYRTVVWNFKLKGADKRKLNIEYYFNGKYLYDIAGSFAQDFYDDKNPLLNIEGRFFNITLACREGNDGKVSSIKINDEEYVDKMKVDAMGWSLHSSFKVDAELQLTIEIIPQDKVNFKTTKVNFRAKGDGNKEKIKTKLLINGNSNLPQTSFLDKLEDGSNPLYQVFGEEPVKLSFIFDEYQGDFHVEKLEIDGQNNSLVKDDIMLNYKVEKSIVVNKTTPTNVVVKFVPKNTEMTEETIWKFQVQGGGKLPPIPRSYVPHFYINDLGRPASPFPDGFKERLIDVSNPPLLIIGGKEINIYLSVFLDNKTNENEILKEVGFVFDEEAEIKKNFTKNPPYAELIHSIMLPEDSIEHTVKVIMYPKKENEYSELIYAFRVKTSGEKQLLPLKFFMNTLDYTNGWQQSFKVDRITLAVEAESDVINEVRLEGEGVTVKKIKKKGKAIWRAEKTVNLKIGEYKEFTFEVEPKDSSVYRKVVHKCSCRGAKTNKSNVDFESLFEPVYGEITFFDGSNNSIMSYGAKKLILKAHTVSAKSKVYYRVTSKLGDNVTSDGLPLGKESDYVHKSGEITLIEDKPTRIIVWVQSESTYKKSKAKRLVFNDVQLKWDKEIKTEGEKFSFNNSTYGEIEVRKSELTNNKMYLAFSIWKDDFAIDESYAYPSYQGGFEKLEVFGERQWYRTIIDVSTLTSSNELEVALPILSGGSLAFTYKVRIKEAP